MLSNGNRFGTGPTDLLAHVPAKAGTVFPVNAENKKSELNPPRDMGLRLEDAFPGAMDDLVNTVALRRLRLGIRHANACGRPGHAKFVFAISTSRRRRKG